MFAALFRRQGIARAAQKYAGRGRANLHRPRTVSAGNIGRYRLIRAHAIFCLSSSELGLEVGVEAIEHALPVFAALGDLVELRLKVGGEGVIHQCAEVLSQTVGNDVAHFFRVQTTAFQAHIAAILNSRDDRRISRWSADAALL